MEDYSKYIYFAAAVIYIVPGAALLTAFSQRWRTILLAALIVATMIGPQGDINFISREEYRGPTRGFELNLTDIIAWGMILGMVVRFGRKLKWLPYNSVWMALFFVFAALSVLDAPVKLYSAFLLLKLARAFCIYWCVYNIMRLGASKTGVWAGFAIAGLYIGYLALKQKYLYGMYRIEGPFEHPNTTAMYLHIITPVLIMWLLCDRRMGVLRLGLTTAAVVGALFAVISTYSRTGQALAAAYVLGALAMANLRSFSGRVLVTSCLIMLIMLGGTVKAYDTIVDRFLKAPAASLGAREEFNHAAKLMLADHPLDGVGANNFSYVLSNTHRYYKDIFIMGTEKHAGVAHHIYRLVAAEMGYPALFVFLIILGRFMWQSLWNSWKSRGLDSLLLWGVFMAFCALNATGFLEWAFMQTPVMYMFVILCGFCTYLAEQLSVRGWPLILVAAWRLLLELVNMVFHRGAAARGRPRSTVEATRATPC